MAYVFESCRRKAECAGQPATGCIELTLDCPDIAASVGSTRTAESLAACAEEYKTFPCEQVNAGELPSCVTPGTRQGGEPCLFNSQCSSLSCSADVDQCGACDTLVGENEDCSVAGVACDFAFVCDETSQTCVKPVVTAPDEPGSEGDACASGPDCGYNLDCDPDSKTCVPFPSLGMSCAKPRTCSFEDGSYCEVDGLTCKALPAIGLPCGVDGFTGTAGYCADGARCRRTSASAGTCEAPAAVNEPCFIDPETQDADSSSCAPNAYCDTSVSPARCAERQNAGESCSAAGAVCQSGLNCLCANNDPACASKVCGRLRIDSQSCSAPGDVCHPGFGCTGGVCVPIDSQGLYDAACQ
jgi:hypothetical protein